MSEHPSPGPAWPETEQIPMPGTTAAPPAQPHPSAGPPAGAETEVIRTAPPAAEPVPTTPASEPATNPADAAYLPQPELATRASQGDPTRPYVTIVLPCYNEGEHVLQEIERITATMNATELTYELLCIDDASTDNTLEVLEQAARDYANLRVMPFRRNGGSGTARRIGTQQARGEVVVWTDADMTYENEKIPDLVRILRDDPTYDQVVGARTTEEGTHKWARVPAKWFIRKVAEKLTNQTIPDLNSGLRAFRREVSLPYLRLLPPGFSCVTTITLAFLSNQHDIKYVPTTYAKRAGQSKFHFVRDAYRYILQVLRMVMYFDPLKVLMPPALWLLVIGIVKGVVDMVRHPFYFPASTVLLVVSGIMIASLALLSDLVVRSRAGV